jgi:phage terminase small subunit
MFIKEYLIDMNGARAAEAVGYSNPSVASWKLLNENEYPVVARAIKDAIAKKEERAEKTADDVLNLIHRAVFAKPLKWFTCEEGKLCIDKKDLKNLPDEVHELITYAEERTIEMKDGTKITKFYVHLINKEVALGLAAKHHLTEHHEIKHVMDWDSLTNRDEADDPIEGRIAAIGKDKD